MKTIRRVRWRPMLLTGLAAGFLAGCGDGGGITVTEEEEEEEVVTALRFAMQPADVGPGEPFDVSVELVADDGSRATGSDDRVTLSASGGATIDGDVSVETTSGLAVFSDISIPSPADQIRLTASAANAGVSAQSTAFSVLDPCRAFDGTAAVGESRTGALDEVDCSLDQIFPSFPAAYVDRWELTLPSRTAIRADLTSGAFDPFLIVVDPQGNFLAFNDDLGGVGSDDLDARISRIFGAGDYVVLATSSFAGQTGSYQLEISEVETCEAVVGSIFLDQTRSGSLEDGDCLDVPGRLLDRWVLPLTEPATFRARLESDDFDPFVGAESVGADRQISGGAFPDSVSVEHVFSPGDYWLFATSDSVAPGAPPAGSYTLSTSAALDEPQDGCFLTSVVGGAVASATIGAADCETNEDTPRRFDDYDLYLLEGETVSVTASAGFEFQFQVQRGTEVLETLRNVPADASRTVELTAGATGFHTFFLLPENPGETGGYELSWSELAAGAPGAAGARRPMPSFPTPSFERSREDRRPRLQRTDGATE